MSEPQLEAPEPENRVLRLLDKAIEAQQPLVTTHIAKLRTRHPEKTPAELSRVLEKQYLAAVTGSGAAAGAAAAAPGVGTAASIALSAGETVASFDAAALLALCTAELHGVQLVDVERRRTLLLSLLLGDGGGSLVSKVAGRTGKHWATQLINSIPMAQIAQINRVLGRNFVTKYGTKQGILVLGRAVPFGLGVGIGAAGNAAVGWGVVKGVRRAFGELAPTPPVVMEHRPDDSAVTAPTVTPSPQPRG